MRSYTFKKAERLCSKTLINNLFAKGSRVITQFPFRVLWQLSPGNTQQQFPALVMVSVSKRNFPRATDRNRIKRQLRELYRLNKHLLYSVLNEQNVQVILSINYQSKELPDYEQLKSAFDKLLKKLAAQILSNQAPVNTTAQ